MIGVCLPVKLKKVSAPKWLQIRDLSTLCLLRLPLVQIFVCKFIFSFTLLMFQEG